MDAKEYLEEVQMLDVQIASVKRKIARQKAVATSITARMEGERVQSSGAKQKIADAVGSYVDIERDELAPLLRRREEILGTVKKVKGKLCFIVLYECYFEGKSLKQITRELKYSYSHIAREHGKGLRQVQRIIGEGGEA